MKKHIITIIVVAIILVAMAAAIFLADKLFYVYKEETVVTNDTYSAVGIDSVTVSLGVGYIEITERADSDSFTVSAVGVNEGFYTVSADGGVLSISSEELKWYDRALYDNAEVYGITIGIPASFDGKLSLGTDAGEIKITGVTVDVLDASTDAGNISVSDSTVATIDISADAGNIDVAASADNVVLTSDVGDISFVEIKSDTLLSSLKVTADVGNIDVSLAGKREEYQITAKTDVGTSNVEDGGDGIYVDLLTDVGNISASFRKY